MDTHFLTPEEKAIINEVIVLEDLGHDMQRIYVDAGGEVVCCDFHTDIYKGSVIDMRNLVVGEPVLIMKPDENDFYRYNKLIVEDIVKL